MPLNITNIRKETKIMKKEKLITRTIISTNYAIMAVNVTKGTVETVNVTISGERDDKYAVDYCNKMWENTTTFEDVHKAVAVTSAEVVETLYGMPESIFMEYATILPPRGSKAEKAE